MANRRIRRTRNFAAYLSAVNQDISRIESRPKVSGLADGIIGGSSLSSSVVLENNYIQSSNYLPGFTGWKIDSNGVAEFGSVFVRGHIDAQTGSIGYWNISTPVVERTFGNRQLFGTFLESRDLGISDNTQTKGSYVGLFKSYSEEGMSITHKYRFNNVATLTVPEHGFENGDYVNITMEDGDIEFGTGESTVRIFNVTKDSFSYVNAGDDFTTTGVLGDYQETFTYGTATLYVKDVAGLYLQDYGRALFDYGYFSNEGISYVSAETPNLVYNSSFEFSDPLGVSFQSDISSWIAGDSAVSAYTFSDEDIYAGDSTYAGQIAWDGTESENYLNAKVNSSEFKRLDFYKNNREIYLNFDMFFNQTLDKVTIPTTSSFVTTSSSVITITCSGHGLAVDDLVYFDFNVSDGASYTYYTNTYRLHTVLSVSGDSFTVTNKFGNTTANPITLSAKYSTNPCIFKYTQPILDLNDIAISFVTGYDLSDNPILDSTTSLYDVLTDVTIANWSDYRYWSAAFPEFEEWYQYSDVFSGSPNATYRPISRMGVVPTGEEAAYSNFNKSVDIKISSSKIEAKYRAIANNEYTLDGEFYLSFPEWVWEATEYSAGNTAPTKRAVKAVRSSGMGYIIDNVSLSPNKKFFFGDSGSSSFYYKLTDDDQVKTNKVSYEAPRQWLDIDLDYQTAQLKYIDAIEFKSSNFLKQLFINPGINTIKESTTVYGYNTYESLTIGQSSVLNVSSGIYKYVDPAAETGYRTVEAFSSQETGTSSAVYQIRTVSSTVPTNNQPTPDGRAGATLLLSVASDDAGEMSGYADRIKHQATKENLLSVNGYANAASHTAGVWILNGLVQIYGSPNVANSIEPSLWIGGDGVSGFRQAGNGATVLGVTHESTTSKIQAYGITNNELTSNYQTVYISNIDNTLGYVSSSIDTKKNVEPLSLTISDILKAEPVQFNYKSEEDGSPKHAGFIAEQLVDSGLSGYVSFDTDGKPVTVNYDMFVSALQSVVRYQASQITNLEDRITRLENGNV